MRLRPHLHPTASQLDEIASSDAEHVRIADLETALDKQRNTIVQEQRSVTRNLATEEERNRRTLAAIQNKIANLELDKLRIHQEQNTITARQHQLEEEIAERTQALSLEEDRITTMRQEWQYQRRLMFKRQELERLTLFPTAVKASQPTTPKRSQILGRPSSSAPRSPSRDQAFTTPKRGSQLPRGLSQPPPTQPSTPTPLSPGGGGRYKSHLVSVGWVMGLHTHW